MNPFLPHGIEHLSPSSIKLFCASPALFVQEKCLKMKGQVGCAAHRGKAADSAITAGLSDPSMSAEDCVAMADKEYRMLAALSADPNKEKEGKAVADIVRVGLDTLRPYGIPTKTQGFIEYAFDDLLVPVVGYLDVFWEDKGIVLDIKTQLALASKIKTNDARQVALYMAAISDNLTGLVCYITPKHSATYTLENPREHLNAMHKVAMTIQRFLSLSADPHELAALCAPDLDSFYFNNAATRQNAFDVYGY